MKCLGLASLCRTIARQHSRLMFLGEGDTNTKFFHLQACHQSQKNMIAQLMHHGVAIVDEELKPQTVFSHFDKILGPMEVCSKESTWTALVCRVAKCRPWTTASPKMKSRILSRKFHRIRRQGLMASLGGSIRQLGRSSSVTSCML
jgi:hypothetical protein